MKQVLALTFYFYQHVSIQSMSTLTVLSVSAVMKVPCEQATKSHYRLILAVLLNGWAALLVVLLWQQSRFDASLCSCLLRFTAQWQVSAVTPAVDLSKYYFFPPTHNEIRDNSVRQSPLCSKMYRLVFFSKCQMDTHGPSANPPVFAVVQFSHSGFNRNVQNYALTAVTVAP